MQQTGIMKRLEQGFMARILVHVSWYFNLAQGSVPQLTVSPQPQHSCLDQIQPTYALANICMARDGQSCATQWARSGCLGSVNKKTGSYQLATGGEEADPWSRCFVVAETKLFIGISSCELLSPVGSYTLKTNPPLSWASLSGYVSRKKTKKHPINISLMFLLWYFRVGNLWWNLKAADRCGIRVPPTFLPPPQPLTILASIHGGHQKPGIKMDWGNFKTKKPTKKWKQTNKKKKPWIVRWE